MCRELIEAGYEADNWVRLGQIWQGRGLHAQAADAYRRAIECIGLREEDLDTPAFPIASSHQFAAFKAMAGLGECLVELGRSEQAAPVLHKAARLCANSVRPYLAFGRLFLNAGDLERAEDAFEMARESTEGEVNAAVCRGLATVHERQGNLQRAFEEWKRGLVAEPSDYACLEGAVRTGVGLTSSEELEGLYRRFLSHRPGNIAALTGLAELLAETGQREEAARLAERVLLLAPTNDRARRVLLETDPSADQRAAGA
jgi:tetratricopeptide (TPR) repeat protein